MDPSWSKAPSDKSRQKRFGISYLAYCAFTWIYLKADYKAQFDIVATAYVDTYGICGSDHVESVPVKIGYRSPDGRGPVADSRYPGRNCRTMRQIPECQIHFYPTAFAGYDHVDGFSGRCTVFCGYIVFHNDFGCDNAPHA